LHLEKSTVSRLADTLEQKDWIVRKTSKEDRRRKTIHLTESGTEPAKTINRARQSRFQEILDHIPDDKRNGVREHLNVFLRALHKANNSGNEGDNS
jgi:DNA-binding MarR family transcriptional regulator